MFFDRDASYAVGLADALRHRGPEPIGEVVMSLLMGGVPLDRWQDFDEAHALRLFRRFREVADGSPALRAAPYHELERFVATVGAALAERVGADPEDPEVTLTAIVIAGLARVWARATFIHVQRVSSMAALEEAVRNDVLRALRIAMPTLNAFDDLVAGAARQDRPRPTPGRLSGRGDSGAGQGAVLAFEPHPGCPRRTHEIVREDRRRSWRSPRDVRPGGTRGYE